MRPSRAQRLLAPFHENQISFSIFSLTARAHWDNIVVKNGTLSYESVANDAALTNVCDVQHVEHFTACPFLVVYDLKWIVTTSFVLVQRYRS